MTRPLTLLVVLIALIALLPTCAGAVAYNDIKAGNPVLPGYFADPCCRKFGDTYYIYVTPDGWGVGEGPVVIWSSKDFVNWTSTKSNWPSTNQKWAPSVIQKDGKYYMYSSIPCQTWIGVADSPLGPFTNYMPNGSYFTPDQFPPNTITLDAECFIDDDGQAYLYYGCWWTPTGGRLNPDMRSWMETPTQFFKCNNNPNPPAGYTVQGAMEAPYMFKRNGIYYYMYSDNFCENSTYQVKYSTSTTGPMGPWTYGKNNPILSTNIDDTVDGPGHHTMLEDNGKVYIIYHRHDNPHSPGGAYRQTCIDELHFNADGSIETVVPSHSGVGYLAPSTKRDTNIALGKPATASTSAGIDFTPAYATDENNGTLWKASSYSYPQWLQVDLGQNMTFKRIETEFQFPQVAYKYQIQYSTNGSTWTNYADRRTNTTAAGPMVDSGTATARYVRITLTGDNSSGRPNPQIAIWNFKIYDGIDKPNQAPAVEAGSNKSGSIAFPTVKLDGVVHDDGLPNGPITTMWKKVSGPGTVTFKNADRVETTATFSAAGAYILKLEASDGEYTSSDTVNYAIYDPGDKLVSYEFNEPNGVLAIDTSGNLQDGYLLEGTKRGNGVNGGAASFDGINDYVLVPALGQHSSFSVSAWVKPDALSDFASILAANGSGTGYPQFAIRGTGEIQLTINGCSPADQRSSFKFTEKDLGKWTHIAAVYDKTAKTVKFYVNGKLNVQRTYTTVQSPNFSSGARIGGWDGGSRNFDGKIDELYAYNRALTASEISAMAASATFLKIGDARKLADGQAITLKAKTVTYAPRDANAVRCTNFFYIEEQDRSAVLRVEDGLAGQDQAEVGTGATVSGIMRTSTTTGERYMELTSIPEIESGAPVAPAYTNTKSIKWDNVLVGLLVKITGKVKSISADRKTMVISENARRSKQDNVEILITDKSDPLPISSLIEVGNFVSVTGVVSKVGTTPELATRVVLMREVQRLVPAVPPILNGLVAWYQFDEGTGVSASDASGNGKTGTLTNGPTWISGKVGKAVNLDGADDHVRLPNAIMQNINDFTICTWVKLDATPQWSRIFDFGSGTGSYMFLCLQNNIGLRYAIKLSNTNEQILDYNTPMPTGTWKHVAVTQTGNTVRIYIDGVQVAQNTGITYKATSLGATSQDYIGKSQYGDPLLDGAVDDFRIYNRALTAAELTQIYNGY